MQIAERTAAWRRERRVLLQVSRAASRLDQAERERSWALAPRAPRTCPSTCSPPRPGSRPPGSTRSWPPASMSWMRRWVSCGLRLAGPEDPDGDDDAELACRDTIADRLADQVGRPRQCTGWLTACTPMTTRPRSTISRPVPSAPGRAAPAPADDRRGRYVTQAARILKISRSTACTVLREHATPAPPP